MRDTRLEKLTRCLNALGLPKEELPVTRKCDPRKVGIATHLRQTPSVTNAWLSQQLFMGKPGTVGAHCGLYERKNERKPAFLPRS